MLSVRVPSITAAGQAVRSQKALRPRYVVVCAKKGAGGNEKLDERGFITKDNSGRQNIFPTSSKAYYSSPTSSAVASSGLGGLQGLAVIAAALGIVALATIAVVNQDPSSGADNLTQLTTAYEGDSLSAVAQRLSKSL